MIRRNPQQCVENATGKYQDIVMDARQARGFIPDDECFDPHREIAAKVEELIELLMKRLAATERMHK